MFHQHFYVFMYLCICFQLLFYVKMFPICLPFLFKMFQVKLRWSGDGGRPAMDFPAVGQG